MLESLYIQNFRLFKELKINTLKRINLIVGKNNVGKSALLEAILIYISKGDVRTINALIHQRGEWTEISNELNDVEKEERILENYSNLLHQRNPIFKEDINSIKINSGFYFLELGLLDFYPSEMHLKQFRYQLGLKLTENSVLSEENNGLTVLPLIFNTTSNYQKHFVPSSSKTENSHLWDDISLTDKEDFVIQALQIIEPNLVRIDFNSQTKKPKARIKGEDKPIPLASMGDGINRILSIILSMVNCENNVFLIDEFETGLHWSVQKDLWKMIFQLSEKLNIQVFATTHSNDTIKALQEVAEELNQSEHTQTIRLKRKDDDVKPIYLEMTTIKTGLEANFEIR